MRKIMFALLAGALALCSCSDDDGPKGETIPMITLDAESGRYKVKQGKDLLISPEYENVGANTTYSWTLDKEVVGTEPTYVFNRAETGEYFLSLRVINDYGVAEEEVKVTVIDLNAPLITLLVPEEGFKIIENQKLELAPEVENGENATFEWKVDGETVSNEKNYTYSSDKIGPHTLVFTARNDDGEDSYDVAVSVCEPSELPFNWEFSQTEYNVATGRSVKLKAYMIENDFDGEYSWKVDGVTVDCKETEYVYEAVSQGEHKVALTMKNEFQEVTQEFTINVCPPAGTYRRPASASSTLLVTKVFEFMPAPGHQVSGYMYGHVFPNSTNMQVICDDVLLAWQNSYNISLGACGGYVVAGFDHSVENSNGDYDLIITGNPYGYQSEPGIIWVSQDENGDGLPNDTWYELKGSEYDNGNEIFEYAVTYYKPTKKQASIKWKGCNGKTGIVPHMTYWNPSDSYYMPWVPSPRHTYFCSQIKDGSTYNDGMSNIPAMDWGYTDNLGSDYFNGPIGHAGHFKLSNAMTFDHKPANLEYIDFVKVQTAPMGYTPNLGEISVEIGGIYDYHIAAK